MFFQFKTPGTIYLVTLKRVLTTSIRRGRRLLVATILLLSLHLLASSQATLAQGRSWDNMPTSLVEDPDKLWQLKDWPEISARLRPASLEGHYGYSNATYWIRIDIPRDINPKEPLYLRVENFGISDIEVFPLRQGQLQTDPITRHANVFPLFSLPFDPGQPPVEQLLIKAKFADNLATSFRFSHAQNELGPRIFLIGTLSGLFCGLLFYNIFLYLTLRNITYIHYSIYAASAGLTAAALQGIPRLLGAGDASARLTPFGACLTLATSLVFTRSYLRLRLFAPLLNRAVHLLSIVAAGLALGIATGQLNQLQYLIDPLIVLATLLSAYAGALAYQQGQNLAWWYLVSWLAALSAALAWTLSLYGLLSMTAFSEHFWHLGLTMQIFILSFGLTRELGRSRDRYEAQLQEVNAQLESKVEERSRQIAEHQQSLYESARLAELGLMAGGIAHEINNPLAVILGFAEQLKTLALKAHAPEAAVNKAFSKIELAITRIQKIIHGLRFVARQSGEEPWQSANIRDIIAETLEIAAQRYKDGGVQLSVSEIPDRDLRIECRAVQISQILINLLNNAFDEVQNKPGAWVRLDTEVQGERVLISVTDSGTGIAPAIREKLFNAFYTTKPAGKGTGLGLAISASIAREHHGSLTYDTASKNTRFVLELPRQQQAAPKEH